MHGEQCPFARALRVADVFLRRWPDLATRNLSEDLAQEAAIETWQRAGTLRRPDRVDAFARTVARRGRYHALRRARRDDATSLDADPDLADRVLARERRPDHVRVAGRDVDRQWLLGELDDVLSGLGALNGRLLIAFYEGFSCAELATRYGLPEHCVKVRLHRSRRRVRETFEERVRDERDNRDG